MTQVEELPGTRITGLSYSLAKIVLNRWLKTKLPTITQLLNVRIPTDAKSQLFARQKSQKLYFDRGAKSLPLVKTGDTIRMKKKMTGKLPHLQNLLTPRSIIVTSRGTLYRQNRRGIIKTSEINKGIITSSKGDRQITKSTGSDKTIIKTPEVVTTRSGCNIEDKITLYITSIKD